MKGQILNYSIQEDSGIVSAEDGNRYRFKSSDWREPEPPKNGMFVDFEPYEGVALDIYIDLEKNQVAAPSSARIAPAVGGKKRVVYILLAIFLGNLGVHNFYAGYVGRGIAQLLISIFTAWLVFPLVAVWLWAIIEACTVNQDASGEPFSN